MRNKKIMEKTNDIFKNFLDFIILLSQYNQDEKKQYKNIINYAIRSKT